MKGKTAYFTCPYCGYSNHAWVKMDEDNRPRVVTCDMENGGCDRDFVVNHHISIKTTVIPFGEEVKA
jgi:transcription elongation factor Elf1